MKLLRRLFTRLKLKVNEAKSAVACPWDRKFLGYSFWVAPGKEVRRRVAPKALERMKESVRERTSRSGGKSIDRTVDELAAYLRGWKAYFRLAQTPRIFSDLDEWIRHRLRAIQLKHWKRGRTAYRALRKLGAPDDIAKRVAANTRRWWRNAAMLLNTVLDIAYFDRLGVPRLT
jgi:RNA-directed DNA polymerase